LTRRMIDTGSGPAMTSDCFASAVANGVLIMVAPAEESIDPWPLA
jgi:hypothetical protein